MKGNSEKLRKINPDKITIPTKIDANRCVGDTNSPVIVELHEEEFGDQAPEKVQEAFQLGYRVFVTYSDFYLAVAPEGKIISDNEGCVTIPEMIDAKRCYGDTEGKVISEIDTPLLPKSEVTPQLEDAKNKGHRIFATKHGYLFVRPAE